MGPTEGSSRGRRIVLCLFMAALGAGLLAGPASAYRSPTTAEKQAVVQAFNKHHGSKAKKLNIEQIRVSTVSSRYYAVLYNDKTVAGGKTYTYGFTTLEYYVRKAGAADVGPVSHATSSPLDFLGPKAPASVEDDTDPLYDVTYRTTPHQGGETITRKVHQAGCGGESTSQGSYHWFAIWKGVQLTLPNLPDMGVPSVDFTGSVTWSDPCPSSSSCPGDGTITYHEGGDSVLSTGEGSFVPLNLSAGFTDDNHYICADVVYLAAQPIVGVHLGLPFHTNGHEFGDKTFPVGPSNFTEAAKTGRLGQCDSANPGWTCTETVKSFSGQVIAQRHYRTKP